MSGNPFLRRLGRQPQGLIERAAEMADSGFWLALRVAPEIPSTSLETFLGSWTGADLASITDVVVTGNVIVDGRVQWIQECNRLSDLVDAASSVPAAAPLVPAAAKGAERLCRHIRSSVVALDEAVPRTFEDQVFGARAEREKSFVRCAKTLLTGVTEGRIERVSMWTRTPRVLDACRAAAHDRHADGSYEFCVPESDRRLAEQLRAEGETVRVWFPLDRAIPRSAVAR